MGFSKRFYRLLFCVRILKRPFINGSAKWIVTCTIIILKMIIDCLLLPAHDCCAGAIHIQNFLSYY